MPDKSISSLERIDDLRKAHPDLGFAIYAFEPNGAVTFEVITPAGETFTFVAETAVAAMAAAFPPESVPADWPEPAPPEPATSIFD